MSNLKNQLIKIGSQNPELQKHIRPVLDKISMKKQKSQHRRHRKDGRMGDQKVAVSSAVPDYIADRIEEGYQNLRKFFHYVDDNRMDYLSGVTRGTKTFDLGVVGTGELHAIREHIVEFEREKRESSWKAAERRLEKIKRLMKDIYPEGRRGVNSLIAELRGIEDRDAEKIAEGLRALKDGVRSASNGIQQAIEETT